MITNMAAPAWRTALTDSLGFVLVVWSIPVAIVVIDAHRDGRRNGDCRDQVVSSMKTGNA